MISRQFVAPSDGSAAAGSSSNGSASAAAENVIFTNAEEEVFVSECDLVLDMDCGAGMSSTRTESPTGSGRSFSSITSDEFVEKRKLLIFKANKLEKITSAVKG